MQTKSKSKRDVMDEVDEIRENFKFELNAKGLNIKFAAYIPIVEDDAYFTSHNASTLYQPKKR